MPININLEPDPELGCFPVTELSKIEQELKPFYIEEADNTTQAQPNHILKDSLQLKGLQQTSRSDLTSVLDRVRPASVRYRAIDLMGEHIDIDIAYDDVAQKELSEQVSDGAYSIDLPSPCYYLEREISSVDDAEKATTLIVYGHVTQDLDGKGNIYEKDSLAIVENTAQQCKDQGFYPVIGIEPEFMLYETSGETRTPYIDKDLEVIYNIAENMRQQGIPAKKTGHHKEMLDGMYEIKMFPVAAESVPVMISAMRDIITDTAAKKGLVADFSPRSDPKKTSTDLHHNISMCNEEGENLLAESSGGLTALNIVAASVLEHAQTLHMLAIGGHQSLHQFSINTNNYSSNVVAMDYGRSHAFRYTRGEHPEHTRIEMRFSDWTSPPIACAGLCAAFAEGVTTYKKLSESSHKEQDSAERKAVATMHDKSLRLPSTLDRDSEAAWRTSLEEGSKDTQFLESYGAITKQCIDMFIRASYQKKEDTKHHKLGILKEHEHITPSHKETEKTEIRPEPNELNLQYGRPKLGEDSPFGADHRTSSFAKMSKPNASINEDSQPDIDAEEYKINTLIMDVEPTNSLTSYADQHQKSDSFAQHISIVDLFPKNIYR